MVINDNVGDGINCENANWKFSGDTAAQFGDHVKKSVPFYGQGHDLICNLCDFFIKENSICYEIGTSVGELLFKMAKHNTHKGNVQWYGIDIEPDMISEAQSNNSYDNVFLEVADINLYEFQKADMIVSYYSIQFIHPKFRQQLISKIYDSLEWGGAFIWFEKVRAPDARFQDMMTSLYNDFKTVQGYSPEEIYSKSRSLKGVLEPFSTQANIGLLERAGFVDITSIMKYICFEGFLAIK
jgi:tRNA (cmo5U34)-methyltransferase